MKIHNLLAGLIPAVVLLSGCGQPVTSPVSQPIDYSRVSKATETTFVSKNLPIPSPIPTNCSVDSDCVLTTKFYHPCGTVFAISKTTGESEVDAYNKKMQVYFENVKFDCPLPPVVTDYEAVCVEKACIARRIK